MRACNVALAALGLVNPILRPNRQVGPPEHNLQMSFLVLHQLMMTCHDTFEIKLSI